MNYDIYYLKVFFGRHDIMQDNVIYIYWNLMGEISFQQMPLS